MRAEKIRDFLKENGADAFLISSFENRRYISGFTGSEGFLLISQREAVLFVDGRYTLQAAIEAKGFEIVHFKASPYTALADYRFNNVYIEDEKVTVSRYNKLQEAFGGAQLLNGTAVLENMRMIKTQEEIASIKKAAAIADKAFLHILKYIKPGISEKDIAIELDFFMRKNGAKATAFNTIAAAAERSALPHAQPTDNIVNPGDFVLMDFGCVVDDYCSDITRTVAVGGASGEMRRVYETVLKAQAEGLNSIKGGESCAGADSAARRIIEDAGFGENFSHSLGHGVGLNVHEKPVLSPSAAGLLQPGNVVTVEPGIYIEGKFGVRIEDLVVVTQQGCVNLTGSAKELLEI